MITMGTNGYEVDLDVLEVPQWHFTYIVHFLVSMRPLVGIYYITSSECFLSNMNLIESDTLIDELDKA